MRPTAPLRPRRRRRDGALTPPCRKIARRSYQGSAPGSRHGIWRPKSGRFVGRGWHRGVKTEKSGGSRLRALGDLVAVAGCSLVVFAIAFHFQIPTRLAQQSLGRNGATSDAAVCFLATLAIGLIIFTSRRWRETARDSAQAEAHRALYDP